MGALLIAQRRQFKAKQYEMANMFSWVWRCRRLGSTAACCTDFLHNNWQGCNNTSAIQGYLKFSHVFC